MALKTMSTSFGDSHDLESPGQAILSPQIIRPTFSNTPDNKLATLNFINENKFLAAQKYQNPIIILPTLNFRPQINRSKISNPKKGSRALKEPPGDV